MIELFHLNEYRLPGVFSWNNLTKTKNASETFFFKPEYNNQFIEDWGNIKSNVPANFQKKLIKLLNNKDIIVGHVHRNEFTKFIRTVATWIPLLKMFIDSIDYGAYYFPDTHKIYIPTDLGVFASEDQRLNWLVLEFLLAHEVAHFLARKKSYFKAFDKILSTWYKQFFTMILGKPVSDKILRKGLNLLYAGELNGRTSDFIKIESFYEDDLHANESDIMQDLETVHDAMSIIYHSSASMKSNKKFFRQHYYQEIWTPSEVICTYSSSIVFGQNKAIVAMLTNMI